MENYRTIVALAKIKELRNNEEYEEAYEVIRGIDFKHVSRVTDFSMIADVCTQLGDYGKAKEAYEKIYKKSGSRHALGELVYLNIKLKDAETAKELLKSYEKMAPNDPVRLIYRYRIQKLEKAPIERRIATLEKWKEEDYNERWGAELCKLYHRQGEDELAIAECDRLIMWFGEGEYIDWAKTLKAVLLGEISIDHMEEMPSQKKQSHEPEQKTAEVPSEVTSSADEYEVNIDEPIVSEDEANAGGIDDDANYAAGIDEAEYAAEIDETDFVSETDEAEYAVETDETEYVSEIGNTVEYTADNLEESAAHVNYPEQEIPRSDDFTQDSSEHEEDKETTEYGADGYSDMTEFGRYESEDFEKTDYEIEAIQYMSDYLAKNSSPYVKLRNPGKEVPVIAGQLGKQLANGTAVLEDFFGNYARMEIVKKQLIRSLDMIFDPLKRGDKIIITGGPKTGKTTLAKKLAKVMNRFGVIRSTKALLIDADRMNRLDFVKQRESLADCSIIIEKAGQLTADTVENLLAISAAYSGRTVIILEDDRKSINSLLRDNPELNSVYNNRIHLPSEYKAADLKGFIFEYLVAQEYDLEIAADAVINERLNALVAEENPNPIAAAIEIAKNAIRLAEKRNSKVLADIALEGSYANADIMTIRAEDFE